MADYLTSIANVGNALQAEYWQRRFLSTLEANLLLDRFGIAGQIPGHSGKSVFWPKFENIAYTIGNISEGCVLVALNKLRKFGGKPYESYS